MRQEHLQMREHLRMRHNYRKLLFGMDDDEPMTKLDAQHYLNYAGTAFAGPSVTSDKNEGLDAAQRCILNCFSVLDLVCTMSAN